MGENAPTHNRSVGSYQQQSDSMPTPAWSPSHGVRAAIGHIQVSSNIRKVEPVLERPHDILERLRVSWLGRFYRRYLKQYYIFRWGTRWVWRYGYPFYVNEVATRVCIRKEKCKAKRWRSLIKLNELVKRNGFPAYKLADAVVVEAPKPNVFPVTEESLFAPSRDRYSFPEMFVSVLKNATTYGGTNLILIDDEVVCHDLYDFRRDSTSEELHGRTIIHPESNRIRLLLYDKDPESIAEAATFVDACAANYAHWLTEVMSRIVLFCADDRFKNIPIVVNEGLHPNIMESLLLVAGSEREIITLPIGRALEVDKLYVTSVAGYVPFGRRTNRLSGYSHGLFSPIAFEALRKCLNNLVEDCESQVWPEKIFLRRNSGTRKVTNASELEELLVARGYVIIEPENLTFMQQVQLFKNAKYISAPTGAALAGAIFCEPGTYVTILMAKHEDMIYRYWCNMLTPIKIKVSYVLGNIVKNRDLGIHGDFVVNVRDVIASLEASIRQ
jgi:capsular polysaccharide biosynthesis protein